MNRRRRIKLTRPRQTTDLEWSLMGLWLGILIWLPVYYWMELI